MCNEENNALHNYFEANVFLYKKNQLPTNK